MQRTISICERVVLDVGPDDAWSYVADYGKDTTWRAGLVEMTPEPPGPLAVGTRVHEVVRKLGSTYVTESTVTAVGPGRTYRFSGSGDSGGVAGGRSVHVDGHGRTVFTYEIELRLEGALAMVGGVVRRVMRRDLRADLHRLQDAITTAAFSTG